MLLCMASDMSSSDDMVPFRSREQSELQPRKDSTMTPSSPASVLTDPSSNNRIISNQLRRRRNSSVSQGNEETNLTRSASNPQILIEKASRESSSAGTPSSASSHPGRISHLTPAKFAAASSVRRNSVPTATSKNDVQTASFYSGEQVSPVPSDFAKTPENEHITQAAAQSMPLKVVSSSSSQMVHQQEQLKKAPTSASTPEGSQTPDTISSSSSVAVTPLPKLHKLKKKSSKRRFLAPQAAVNSPLTATEYDSDVSNVTAEPTQEVAGSIREGRAANRYYEQPHNTTLSSAAAASSSQELKGHNTAAFHRTNNTHMSSQQQKSNNSQHVDDAAQEATGSQNNSQKSSSGDDNGQLERQNSFSREAPNSPTSSTHTESMAPIAAEQLSTTSTDPNLVIQEAVSAVPKNTSSGADSPRTPPPVEKTSSQAAAKQVPPQSTQQNSTKVIHHRVAPSSATTHPAQTQILTPLTMDGVTPYTASTEEFTFSAGPNSRVHQHAQGFPAHAQVITSHQPQNARAPAPVSSRLQQQQPAAIRIVNDTDHNIAVSREASVVHEGATHVTSVPQGGAPVEQRVVAEAEDEQPVGEPIISLENVQKTYLLGVEGVPALRGVSLEIMKGEFVIVYGTSGGGKTSLLNIIGTIDKATKGRIQIGKSQVREQTKDSQLANIRLKKIGFVFQTFNLLSTMTALENVEMPMILRGKLTRAARRKRAKELLRQVGMGERIHHRPAQLSGGEQQRVTIARAIANEPEIMILDEPTGDLDTKNTRMVMNLLRRLNREDKITLVMVTHDPGLKNSADRVVRMRDGKVAGIEVISEKVRNKFWTDLQNQMPTDVADDDHGEVRRDSARKMTEIREPRNYAQFRSCLTEATTMAEEMLHDCISRSRPGYGGDSVLPPTSSIPGSTPGARFSRSIPPRSATSTGTTLTRRSRRTVYDDDSPVGVAVRAEGQIPVNGVRRTIVREVPASAGVAAVPRGDFRSVDPEHVSIRIREGQVRR